MMTGRSLRPGAPAAAPALRRARRSARPATVAGGWRGRSGDGSASGGSARVPLSELGAVDAVFHTVRPGDTVRAIAAEYGLAAQDVLKLNPEVNPRAMHVGTKLLVQAPRTQRGRSSLAARAVVTTPVARGFFHWPAGLSGADASVVSATAVALLLAGALALLAAARAAAQRAAQASAAAALDALLAGGPAGPAPRVQRFTWGGRAGLEDAGTAAPA